MEQPQSPVATDIGASASQEKGGESAFICSCHLLHVQHSDDIACPANTCVPDQCAACI